MTTTIKKVMINAHNKEKVMSYIIIADIDGVSRTFESPLTLGSGTSRDDAKIACDLQVTNAGT